MPGAAWSIFLNVVGGALTVALIEMSRWLILSLRHRRFRQVFGQDVANGNEFHLVYAPLSLRFVDGKGVPVRHAYEKARSGDSGMRFSVERPVSSCEVRSAKYLAETMGAEVRQFPSLSADEDVKGRLDLSFVSFGSLHSNWKSGDALEHQANRLVSFSGWNLISRLSGRNVLLPEPGFDYGLILKLHPTQFSKRVWLVCGGLGEWGTSGAAWYLAHRWRQIQKLAGAGPFAVVVRVKPQMDESAEPVLEARNAEEVENYAELVARGSGKEV